MSAADKVSLVVTGFGVFADVLDNPSMRIVEELSSNAFECDGKLGHLEYKILEVSVDHCCTIHDKFLADTEGKNRDNTVFVHIGVDSKGTHIKLEECAYNNMTFRVPDVAGFQPENETIVSECALDEPLRSDLPLAAMCRTLNETFPAIPFGGESTDARPVVQLSQDPGRYLCNYVYFQAMQHQKAGNKPLRSVFVHVPAFSTVPQEVQVGVVKKLLNLIASHVNECK